MVRPKYVPIPEEVMNLFYYSKGQILYKSSGTGRGRNGRIAGSGHPYKRVKVKGRRWFVHRIIWTMFYGEIPDGMMVDHINRNRLDNRIENLRLVDNQGNQFNNSAKNISWCRQTSKWKVSVMVGNKSIGSKRFDNFCFAYQYRNKLREARMNV